MINCKLICTRGISAFSIIAKRSAGHSKWANIKHIKAQKDSERGALHAKLSQRIRVAIQEGGSSNPLTNIQLAQAIEFARKQNMPETTIQSSVKSAETDASKAKVVSYEIRGPKGCLMIITALTENSVRTKNEITPIVRKNGAAFTDSGARHLFDHKAVIKAKPPEGLENVSEMTIDHAIECGAEEVEPSENEDGLFEFICHMNQMNIVQSKLQKLKYEIISADFDFVPRFKVSLSDQEMEQMSKLIDKLEGFPNVVKIYDNIE